MPTTKQGVMLINKTNKISGNKSTESLSCQSLSLHDKAKLIVENDVAFRKLKEDLREKKMITSLGINTVLKECIDSRIESSKLQFKSPTKPKRLSRTRFVTWGDLLSNSSETAHIAHSRPSFDVRSGTQSRRRSSKFTLSVLQKIQDALHLEDEIDVFSGNDDVHTEPDDYQFEKRTSTLFTLPRRRSSHSTDSMNMIQMLQAAISSKEEV